MDEMVSLTKAQVPAYLVNSEFYNSLSAEDEEEFSIPRKFLKPTVTVTSGAELAHLFHTMKFWGVMSSPSNIIELLIFKSVAISDGERDPIRDVLLEFELEFKLSRCYGFRKSTSKRSRLDTAVASGREDVLEYVVRVDGQVNAVVIKAAAEYGYFNLLQRVVSAFVPGQGKGPFEKVSTATVANRGHADCLLYVLENGCKKEKFTCRVAAANGHLACLQVAREQGCMWDQGVLDAATLKGHLNCLQYAVEHSSKEKVVNAACIAAQIGQVECLQYILDQGVAATKRMCYAACEQERGLPCLKLLRARGAPLDVICVRRATMYGSVACLQYLFDEGCKVDSSVALEATQYGRDRCLELLLAAGCSATSECVDCAALGEHLGCVKVLRKYKVHFSEEQMRANLQYSLSKGTKYIRALFEGGYSIPQWALATVAQNGDVECVEYMCANRCCELTADATIAAARTHHSASLLKVLHRYGCPWDEAVCARTARNDDIGGLSFAHSHGCPWDATTTTGALNERGRQCLQYALLHDCPFNEDACDLAAKRGWRDILQLLHERGCPLTLKTCVAAATYKYGDCLTYAVTHGAPLDASVCVAAVKTDPLYWEIFGDDPSYDKWDSLRLLQYARELGCPWDEQTILEAIDSEEEYCLKYALSQGCPCTANACELAAGKSRYKLLQILHENGCPWDASTTTAAARAGELDTLLYALRHHCPCDVNTSLAAAEGGDRRMLKLLHEYGCPWDKTVSQAAAASGNIACLRYCVEHGCPINKATMEKYNNSS